MTEKKEFPNHEEPSESDTPKITAANVEVIADQVLRDLLVHCKTKGEVILAKDRTSLPGVAAWLLQVRPWNFGRLKKKVNILFEPGDLPQEVPRSKRMFTFFFNGPKFEVCKL